jgi:MFS family permease
MFISVTNRHWWVTLNISIGVYMSTLDASIVNITLPTITEVLNTQLKTVAWVVMSYLIVITGCLLLMGKLADLFGQRRVYLFGLLTFTLGSAFCGFSPTVYFLIGSRMIQGLGASALMAIGPAIITNAFPEKDRGQALGIIGSIVSIGFITSWLAFHLLCKSSHRSLRNLPLFNRITRRGTEEESTDRRCRCLSSFFICYILTPLFESSESRIDAPSLVLALS